jgi:hypothetical protein
LWFVVGGARSLEFTTDGSSKVDTRIFTWLGPPECNTLRLGEELYCCVSESVQDCVGLAQKGLSEFGACLVPRLGSYIVTWAPTCDPEVDGTLYNM